MIFSGAYKGRKVLVTGHSGFKGSWLCQWLMRLGADVTGISLFVPSTPSNFELLGLERRVRHHTANITHLDQLTDIFAASRPAIVFHLAAQSLVRRAYEEPKLTFDTNTGGTVNVLEAIRRTSSVEAAVLITSDKCYENVEWEFGYRETDRLGGKDPYSASKAAAEVAFSAYARSFFAGSGAPRLATTRAGNVIGGGDWAQDRVVPDCVRAWSKGEPALIRNPSSTRPWQHVLEPLSGYLCLGARLLEGHADFSGSSFNFGPAAEVNHSVGALIEEMRKTWPDGAWRAERQEAAPQEARLLKLNCDRALHLLGWRATLSFEQSVEMTASWYLHHHRGGADMAAYADGQLDSYERLARELGRTWAT